MYQLGLPYLDHFANKTWVFVDLYGGLICGALLVPLYIYNLLLQTSYLRLADGMTDKLMYRWNDGRSVNNLVLMYRWKECKQSCVNVPMEGV